MDYYKIWTLLGQMTGQQKFRGQTNYETKDFRIDYMINDVYNIYKYEYPVKLVQKLLGPVLFQVKFFGMDLRTANLFILDFYR